MELLTIKLAPLSPPLYRRAEAEAIQQDYVETMELFQKTTENIKKERMALLVCKLTKAVMEVLDLVRVCVHVVLTLCVPLSRCFIEVCTIVFPATRACKRGLSHGRASILHIS